MELDAQGIGQLRLVQELRNALLDVVVPEVAPVRFEQRPPQQVRHGAVNVDAMEAQRVLRLEARRAQLEQRGLEGLERL